VAPWGGLPAPHHQHTPLWPAPQPGVTLQDIGSGVPLGTFSISGADLDAFMIVVGGVWGVSGASGVQGIRG
jgi:hypothetical protein